MIGDRLTLRLLADVALVLSWVCIVATLVTWRRDTAVLGVALGVVALVVLHADRRSR